MTAELQRISWTTVENAIKKLARVIPEDIRWIYGIPTGGAWLAHILCSRYGYKQLEEWRMKRKLRVNSASLNDVFVVDDLIDSGRTLEPYRKRGMRCAVLFSKSHSPVQGEISFVKIDDPYCEDDPIEQDDKKFFDDVEVEPMEGVFVADREYDSNLWLVFPWERSIEPEKKGKCPPGGKSLRHDTKEFFVPGPEDAIVRILEWVGEDLKRPGLIETPQRVLRSFRELFSGYNENPATILKQFDEDVPRDEIILMKDIEFFSTCEHHMLPFYGVAHVAYIPGDEKKIVGASKLARLLDIYARRLQVQERICMQVCQDLTDHLNALGAACIIEARHMCMCARGVGKQNSKMVTSTMLGVFRDKAAARNELLLLINSNR